MDKDGNYMAESFEAENEPIKWIQTLKPYLVGIAIGLFLPRKNR